MLFFKKYFIFFIALGFLALAGMMVTPLYEEQIRYDLSSDPVEGAGPDVVLLTTALGAFRGVVINVIWVRMESLKQDGKFFEIAQLAELACKLAPRFPKVWDFNAWNMAYNISVQIPELNERWPWVRRGIALLRDQGIPNNPEEPELYFSLGWIYMHKIGDDLDDAHYWYKQRLGLKMHEVLQGEGSREMLGQLAEMPSRRETLLSDEDMREFYQQLLQTGFDPLSKNDAGDMKFFVYERNPDSVPDSAVDLMQDERYRNQKEAIALFSRNYRLRTQLKLIPEFMLYMMDEYGPLDWRNPFAHAIYWANLGRRAAIDFRDRTRWRRLEREGVSLEDIARSPRDFDDPQEWAYPYRYRDIDYDRIIYGSLQKLVTDGRLLFDTRGRLMPMTGPDYRFTDSMIEQFKLMLDKYEAGETHMRGIESAFEHFLRRASIEFFYMGSRDKSREYFELLKEKFPKSQYDVSHESFITSELETYIDMASPAMMRRLVRGLLYQSYFNLAGNAPQRAEALHERARRLTTMWNEEIVRSDEDEIRQYVDFARIRESALIDIFSGVAELPGDFLDELREQLPDDLRRRVEEAAQKAEEERRPMPFDEPLMDEDLIR